MSSSAPFSFILLFSLFLLLSILDSSVICAATLSTTHPLSSSKYIFSFGDSYTASAFNPVTGKYNFNTTGLSASDGQTWIQYLTQANNSTTLYNYATPSATISSAVVPGIGAPDFVSQVSTFIESTSTGPKWTANDSLFTIWFGLEDLAFIYASGQNFEMLQPTLLTEMDNLVGLLYASGARRFLFLNMPPIDKTPLAISLGVNATRTLKASISFWNSRLSVYTNLFSQIHENATAYTYDTQPYLSEIIDNGINFGFKNATGYCVDYALPTVSNDSSVFSPSCVNSLSDYVWKDSFDLTYPVHALMSDHIISVLNGNSTSSGFSNPDVPSSSPLLVLGTITPSDGLSTPTATSVMIPVPAMSRLPSPSPTNGVVAYAQSITSTATSAPSGTGIHLASAASIHSNSRMLVLGSLLAVNWILS